MTANWSDGESTIVAPSKGSIRREVQGMYEVIKKERGNKNTVIIAVVRPEGLAELERRCQRKWWNIRQGNSAVLITINDSLQATIDNRECDKPCRRLILLVSGGVREISFDVHSHIHILKILRCGDLDANRQLLINGSSTFNTVRLDMWQAKSRTRSVYLGPGVRIKVELNGGSSWARSTDQFDPVQKEELRRHLHKMEGTSGNGAWDEWKGPVTAILGLIVGTGKAAFNIKAEAGGIYATYMFAGHTVEFTAAYTQMAAVAATAGPAILLGVGVAAAVYFIPWKSVFAWLEGAISWLWKGIGAIWARFQSCMASIFGNNITGEKQCFTPRPMEFPG